MTMNNIDLIDSICGSCGREVGLIELKAYTNNAYAQPYQIDDFEVYMCPRCHSGCVLNMKLEYRLGKTNQEVEMLQRSVVNNSEMYTLSPGPMPMPKIANLPDDVEGAWDEVLNAGRGDAWTAAELMCRKILMHIAVDQFEMEEGKAFVAYVKKFEEEGFFPRMMHPVIDGIRERGNRATHDLAPSTKQQAMKTLEVTHHVLRTIYEISFQAD